MRCVLVSCCGLPAAGKTTFCRSATNCTASSTTTSSTSSDAHSNAGHMATTETFIMSSAGTMTASPSSTKQFNRLGAVSVFRVRHVCFDEHIDQARQRHRRQPLASRQPSSGARTHLSGEGETHEETQQYREEGHKDRDGGHEDRDKNASIRNGAKGDTNPTKAAAVEVDAMQHAGLETQHYSEGGREDRDRNASIRSRSESNTSPTNTAAVDADAVQHAGLAEDEEDTARWWHEGRREAMSEIEALLAAARSRAVNSPPSPGPAAEEAVTSSAKRRESDHHEETVTDVVIADDNMHFRSMRHELLCLARKYGCGYAQVYFPTDVEVAVERNRGRAGPVAEAVIRKMAASIQPPDPERFKWERHTSIIEPQGFRRKIGGVLEGDKDADALEHRWASSSLSGTGTDSREGAPAYLSFWRVIAAAAEDPVPPLPAPSTVLREQESDRAATKASFLHQLDLELRESVKRVADKAADGSLTRENLRAVMAACSVSRKSSLRLAKGGHWTQQGTLANGEDTADPEKKINYCCVEGSNSSSGSGCVPGGEGGGKVAILGLSPMQEFSLEFEEALSRFSWMVSSVRRELVEAARGAACTKL